MSHPHFSFQNIPEMLQSDNKAVRTLAADLPADAIEIDIENSVTGSGRFDVFYRVDKYKYLQGYDAQSDHYRLVSMSAYQENVAFDLGAFSVSPIQPGLVRTIVVGLFGV